MSRRTDYVLALIITVGVLIALVGTPASARPADSMGSRLGRLLHGEPAAPEKAPIPKVRAVVSSTLLGTPDAPTIAFLNLFADAVFAREGAKVFPSLSAKYEVEGVPSDRRPREFLAQAIERMPGPTALILKTVSVERGVKVVTVEFQTSLGASKDRHFRFDSENKLMSSDLFALRREVH